jgi:hypothetical protein
MSDNNYPVPPSHRTFVFGKVTVDSNFDSGNCSYAERVSPTTVLRLSLSTPFGSLLTMSKIPIVCGSTFRS